jgi:hypothetical protein
MKPKEPDKPERDKVLIIDLQDIDQNHRPEVLVIAVDKLVAINLEKADNAAQVSQVPTWILKIVTVHNTERVHFHWKSKIASEQELEKLTALQAELVHKAWGDQRLLYRNTSKKYGI